MCVSPNIGCLVNVFPILDFVKYTIFDSRKSLFPATMVESQTVVGTKQHGRGTVDAQIIKADIPVQVEDIFAIPHICHRHHRRCLCKFFLPGVIFFQIEREKLAFYCIVYNNLIPSV